MNLITELTKEFNAEVALTRKMLERVPNDQWDFKPHEKSMTMKQLTVHLAEIPAWVPMGLTTSGLDFAATPYKPTPVHSTQELMSLMDASTTSGAEALAHVTEEQLLPDWTMKYGDTIIMSLNKYELIRHAINQMIHHRAQLGIYLRLLNIPIPGVYGPSADENMGM